MVLLSLLDMSIPVKSLDMTCVFYSRLIVCNIYYHLLECFFFGVAEEVST